MKALRKPYEPPTIIDLGSIADHTFTCSDDGWPPKGGIPPDAHCDKHQEWSGGTGEDLAVCSCDPRTEGRGPNPPHKPPTFP